MLPLAVRRSTLTSPLEHAIEHAAHFLPAQGPITVFIHHNTLHAFEHMPFEEAVVEGGRLLGCEPFLSEERYREELRRGRIRESDLEAVLRGEARGGTTTPDDAVAWSQAPDLIEGNRTPPVRADGSALIAAEPGEGVVSGHALRLAWLKHGVPEAEGTALDWLLRETDLLDRLRPDLSDNARASILGHGGSLPHEERALVRALWEACLGAVISIAPAFPAPVRSPVRHRDHLLAATGLDADELVHPLLIRLSAAYLDQGIAARPMPLRKLGFFGCVTRLYALPAGSPDPWMRSVHQLMAEEVAAGRTPLESLGHSLDRLGVEPREWDEFLTATALVLRGWAGMMRQMEERPDRVPVHAPPATLADFLAIRLLLDRAAAAEVARALPGPCPELSQIRGALAGTLPAPRPPSVSTRAWPLFHIAQILGLCADEISGLSTEGILNLLAEIEAFDGVSRRRLFHLAYERRLRHQWYDAVATHEDDEAPAHRFDAIFCLDEREESIRRHLEEVTPECRTFGAAGFFGVAMYYRGAAETHSRPLCPVGIRPEHEVVEIRVQEGGRRGWREQLRRTWGHFGIGLALGSRSVVRGTLGTVLLGALAAIPLVLRVLAPRMAARILHRGRRLLAGSGWDLLVLEHRAEAPAPGRREGFTPEEMAAIVRSLLEETGLSLGMAPIVLVVGHGSTSLNNPHESAHDCGACGGGRGGPNARAFAQMANHPEVRGLLASSGLPIPEGTWFVGAEHNTASDSVDWFDLDRVPEGSWPGLREAMGALEEARMHNAHERCRRFRAAPLGDPPRLALEHVEMRSEDLAQTRPEYGHATNAFCLVGRRSRTRGLFLDRRAFLVSYDPTADDAKASILARILAAVVPVAAGINLEYYFAEVDPSGYGCGTKLPHNVTALLGVMDGHSSDLRTGLPRQMVEIHEPVRLTLLVETPAEVLRDLVRANPLLDSLVSNRWIVAAALDPGSGAIHELRGDAFVKHEPEQKEPLQAPTSADWYSGRRDFLGFARILPAAGAGMRP